MENIETLLAAVAQTQGFDDDEPVVSTPPELGLKNSVSAAATGVVAGVSGDVRPSPVVETPVPAPAVGRMVCGGEKRKRGRPPKAQLAGNPPPPKRVKVEDEEEDVCFICFDGGSLVLCDRKGCPKAYHPACIKRDEAFFKSKAKWNCGWHICSVCRKASHYLCYTCSYSLCKACTKNEEYVCVRGNKGFCSTCIKPIMLIENKDQATNESIQVDFDDKFSWEYLFKMYWLLLKEKLSLTLSELTQAKNPWKGVATEACKPHSSNVLHTAVGREVSMPYRSAEHLELNKPRVDINLIHNDGLRTSSNGDHMEKLNSDKGGNEPSYNKDTVQQNTDKVINETSTDRATSEPLIEKVVDDCSTAKDTDKPCISQNTNTRESDKPAISSIEWASKDLLEFVAHMKNGDTTAISQFDVQKLLLDYIKRNNLRDPRRKSQIICDQRLTNLFGKPRVGHIEMLKLLEFHYLIKEDSHKNSFIPAGFVSSVGNDLESDGKIFGLAMPVNSRKRKTRKKSEDRSPQHDVNEYAAIDAHNINLIYLRRNLMENLTDDRDNFNNKVIGSIVRIRISTHDQKPEVHRLVQVVGTSKVLQPYKIGTRTADVMLEVLNLDKKEVVSLDAISNQEFTEEECRRLRQSIRCGLVKHFTVGEVQNKAVALQSVRVNDWLEAEVLKLNHLRDRASEKGRKKELRECVERLELLKSPEERKRKICEVPEIHADPKMSPNYESEEDYRSDGDGKKEEYTRPSYSQFPRNGQKTHYNKKGKEDRSTKVKNQIIEKTDASGSSSLDKHMIGTSPNNGRNDHAMQRSGLETSTAASCAGNSPSSDNIETEKLWHYRDPNGKIQGPFSMMQLRKWSTTGLFPPDMRIWTNHEQYDSLLLTDALSGKFHAASNLSHTLSSCSHENKPVEAVGVREGTNGTSRDHKQTEVAGVVKAGESGSSSWPQCWGLLKDGSSSVDDVKARNLPPSSSPETRHVALADRCQEGDDFNRGSQTGEKNSIGITQSAVISGCKLQSQSNNEDRAAKPSEENSRSLNIDLSSNDIKSGSVSAPVADSSKQAETAEGFDLPSPTRKAQNPLSISADVTAQNTGVLELLSPSPRSNNENQGAQATETKQPGFINLPVSNSGLGWNGNVQLPEVADEWCGYSPTPARSSIQEWDPGLVSAPPLKPLEVKNEIIDTSLPVGHQVAHDSSSHPVSSWLAILNDEPIEFVALGEDSVSDLLAEVDALESQGALPSPTAALKFARELLEDSKDDCFSSIEEFSSAHELRKSDALSSTGDVHLTSQSSAPCKPNGTSPVDAFDFFRRSSANSSASSEGETNAPVHSSDAGSEIHPPAPTDMNQEIIGKTMALGTGSDPTDPSWGTLQGNTNINLVTVQGNVNLVLGGPGQGMGNLGWGTNPGPAWANPSTNRSPRNSNLPWDGQRKYGGGGERFNSPREWGYQGGESGFGRGRPPWGRQMYGGGGGGGGGGYSRPVPKGQRVCKFYEGGHCKKGAFCDYLHP